MAGQGLKWERDDTENKSSQVAGQGLKWERDDTENKSSQVGNCLDFFFDKGNLFRY